MRNAAVCFCLFAPAAILAQGIHVGTAVGQSNVHPDQVLLPGEQVVTGDAARVDLRIDPSVNLRLYPNTEARIAVNSGGAPRVELVRGQILSGVVDLGPVFFEIGTPQVAVRPDMPGSVRVVVSPANESEIDALTSDVEVVALTGSKWLRLGQKMYVRGTAADPEFKIVNTITWANPPAVVAVNTVRIVRASDNEPRPLLTRQPPASSAKTAPGSTPVRPSFPGRGK